VDLAGRVAIVTGASGGIGSVTVREFARSGVHQVLVAPPSEAGALAALVAEAELAGVRALAVPADISDRTQVDRMVLCALEAFGTIDILANVAGIGSSPSFCDESADGIERVLAVNLLGCAHAMHAVLPVMKRQRRGSIVNVGSVAGEAGVMGIYSASKFGLRGLTDSVRREVRSDGIGVTLIEPGFVRTQLNAAMGDGLPGPEIVARAIVGAARRARRRIIVPAYYAIPVWIVQTFPWLTDAVFGNARIQERLNRDARAQRISKELVS
jgi:NAD(P)-dependent dehydrogenase (short-subunit alcohol dehydrogenase family)